MAEPMSDVEYELTLRGLQPRLERFAELLVAEGVAVTPGQEVVLTAPVEEPAFCRTVARKAYDLGAGHVTVIWQDDALARLEYDRVPTEWFETVPAWKRAQMNDLAAQGACFLFLDGGDPDVMDGVDAHKVAVARYARNTQCDRWRHGMDFAENTWCIGGVATPAWARKVFPHLREHEAVIELWQAILDTSRVGEDPESEWETHAATLRKDVRTLDEWHFERLHYQSSNGTDLTIGLPAGHIWGGGAHRTVAGHAFMPNIPTEEVFSTPDRNVAEGVVHSALPLAHGSGLVEDFWFRFHEGRVVDFGAVRGGEILQSILDTDEGARHLGECALISKNTPIRQSGLIFYKTLFDENASCHLALGMGFPDAYEGGEEMSADDLLAAGVNRSATHVDFMVGADDLSVTGIRADGEEIPVFINGQWAWE